MELRASNQTRLKSLDAHESRGICCASNSAAYWLLMQIGMIVGFFTSWPANVWLVNRGIKVPM